MKTKSVLACVPVCMVLVACESAQMYQNRWGWDGWNWGPWGWPGPPWWY
jgi:hypothetical protein